jgi:glutamate-1-semialdehyde aminotransferase
MASEKLHTSYTLFSEALKLIPGGAPQSRHPDTFIPGYYPLYISSGKGSRIYDVDGNSYIDWLCSYGPIVLGHAYDRVDDAVIERIRHGFCFDTNQPVGNELAMKLIDLIPCAEMVRFLKTGSCATTAAVRIARIHTGKNKVLRCGFHGWHDWSYGGAGVPPGATEDVHPFTYNDLESLELLVKKYRGSVAAVIMMPLETTEPLDGFLENVRKITREEGIVLIFDEIRSGFRMAPGGAQEYYGVTPDLATFSKAIANGYPLACVVGKSDVMSAATRSFISATFIPNSVEMVAALETIRVLEEKNAVRHFFRIGTRLQEGLRALIGELGLESSVKVTGVPVMPYVEFCDENLEKRSRLKNRFFVEAASMGVFLHPNHHWFTCLAHSETDVDETLEVCRKAMKTAKEKLNVEDDIARLALKPPW